MSWMPTSWRADKDADKKEKPKKAREEVKHRLPTQMRTKKRWCRNCLKLLKESDPQCPHCGVLNRQPYKAKPRGV